MGDRHAIFEKAAQQINDTIGSLVTLSARYESEPWGKTDQPNFLNQVLIIQTSLAPVQILIKVLAIEKKLGRVREEKWGARLIDIDLLYFENAVIESDELTLPHPGIAARRFVLEPLVEVVPDFIHPVLKKTQRQLLAACDDTLFVKRL